MENSDKTINVFQVLKRIYDQKRVLLSFLIGGFIFGIIVALISPKEYLSSAKLMPEYSLEGQNGASRLLQQYGGLLGLSGGTYSGNSNAIRIELYPEIVQSIPFMIDLMNEEFYFRNYNQNLSLKDYYLDYYDPNIFIKTTSYIKAIPSKISSALASNNQENNQSNSQSNSTVISLTLVETEVIEILRQRISANLDEETGIVVITAIMDDPNLSADVANYTFKKLTNYLVQYRTEKVNLDLDFIESQVNDAETRFYEIQRKLAEFRDSNQGTLTAIAKTEEQKLNSEYSLAFNIYNSLAQQYEEAKLRVQEQTPVFKVLQPVQVPVKKYKPKRSLIVIYYTLIGFTLGMVWLLLVKDFYSQLRNTIYE